MATGSSPRPYGGYFDEVVDTLAGALGEDDFAAAIERVVVYRDELTLEVRREQLPAVAQTIRDHPGLRFELCLGVSGVHYPDDADQPSAPTAEYVVAKCTIHPGVLSAAEASIAPAHHSVRPVQPQGHPP